MEDPGTTNSRVLRFIACRNTSFDGDSARLYQKLVKGDESVVSIEGGVDERRGPSAFYIFALPKPGEEVADIREKIFAEIKSIAQEGPSEDEMEKLRNSLCNDSVRGRQSTMYRAQRLAEFALYDSNPALFDAELDHYLDVTVTDIKNAVSRFIDLDNRVADIVPATTAEVSDAPSVASPQPPATEQPELQHPDSEKPSPEPKPQLGSSQPIQRLSSQEIPRYSYQ
jgi:predicted Zn-dependent peptidase